MILLFLFVVGIAYLAGFIRGEGHEERMARKCYGKDHIYNRTGWDGASILKGRAMYHCPRCGSGFDKKKVFIPKVVDEIFLIKQLGESHPKFSSFVSNWNQVKKFMKNLDD